MKLEEYQTAKAAFEAGASLAPGESRYNDLIKDCDELIAGRYFPLPAFEILLSSVQWNTITSLLTLLHNFCILQRNLESKNQKPWKILL